MNTLDQPSASMPAHASRYAISLHSQLVRQKRPGDKSLLDFPTTVATANRHHRRQRMRRTLASAERACANNVSTDATSSSLERSYVELLKETYKDRSYYGGPSDECPHCGAVFWFQERVKSLSAVSQRRLVYNLCCRGGKIVLEPYRCPPSPLCDLLRFDGDSRARRFLRQIRSYNSLFAFTSLGAVVDRSINNGTAPYVFKINGVVHHRIGSLLPNHGLRPQFAQLYIYDTEHEVQNRLGMFENEADVHDRPDPEVARLLLNMLDEHNKLVAAFRFAKERLDEEGDQKVTLRLLGCNTRHDAQYNLPTNGELAAVIVGDCSSSQYKYDVLVHAREGGLKHVSCLHPSYMALQYPLLFPYGDRGYHLGIKYADVGEGDVACRKYVTMLEFVRHRSHYRLNEPNPFTCYGRLSNQLAVDAYSTIEASRLQFIADHQKELRCESVQGITDAIGRGLTSADSVGGRVIVPASFTGGRRYHVMNYQDAMAICRVYGPPDLFVTFTCNPKWKEIVDALRFEPGQQACDRSDIVVRVFHMKVDEFIADIREDKIFGPIRADVVGVVSVISHVSSLRTRGRQAEVMKRTVTISNARDTGPTVDVVLWGERATAFPAEQIHRDSRSSPQIIVFVGTLVRSYADNVSLSGGSSCKWYINAPLPEVNALRASAETNHNPVIWDQGKAAAESTVIAVPEHKKLKDIKYLHPFENKKKEWLVVVKILKIDRSWWYNACKKCLRTTKPHGDTYKCTNNSCDSIGSPTPSSRGSNLFFGLAANSAVGHGSGVAQNRGAAFIREPSLTPESHKVSSSAKCNIQTTPHQGDNLLQGTEIITSPPNVQAPSGAAYSVLDGSTNKAHKSVVGKRSRTSPSKKVAKKLFRDEDTGDDDVAGSADVDAE
ncbi:putative replication protein [Zea mays]|uniref:Putative replication protein n=2 Tax=Zea mays TaxID=4577 RepID=A0A1D6MKE1_MAIZE|nr:putative replication protein [Zea mays]